MRGSLGALVVAFVVFCSPFAVTDTADAAAGRIRAPAIKMNAPVIKVAVKNGRLQIGDNLHVVYRARRADPVCDDSGSTLFVGHAWRSGNGVADKWGKLRKGDVIRVGGCKHKVIRNEVWSKNRSIAPLSRSDGPPRVRLYACKADDYSKRQVVTARRVGGSDKPFPRAQVKPDLRIIAAGVG